MARYIDADKLCEDLRGMASILAPFKQSTMLGVIETINLMPTADVVEVAHAKWEINCDGYYPYCSNCMTEPKSGVMSKYCPECGAKMDGGAER